jgi:hypothetical protein
MSVNAAAAPHIPSTATHIPPARAARDQIASNPDLAADPFGKLVSEFARGLHENASSDTPTSSS